MPCDGSRLVMTNIAPPSPTRGTSSRTASTRPPSSAAPSARTSLAPDTGHVHLTGFLSSRVDSRRVALAAVGFQVIGSVLEVWLRDGHTCAPYATELDWWMLFAVVFPATLLIAPRIAESTQHGLETMASTGLAIARARPGTRQSPESFLAALTDRVAPRARRPMPGADGAVLRFRAVVLVATGICITDCLTAAEARAAFGVNVHTVLHAVPYCVQGVVMVVMVATLHRFCLVLAAVLDEFEASARGSNGPNATGFEFAPLALDPARRLGLGPLARAFDHALVVAALLAAYAVVVRLEMGEWGHRGAFLHNLKLLVEKPWKEALLSPEAYGLTANVPPSELLVRFVPAAAATVVLSAMVWFPLYRWRSLAGRWKADAWRAAAEAVRAAEEAATPGDPRPPSERTNDEVEAARDRALRRRLEVLAAVNESTVWPNGAERASVLLGLTAALVVVAWFPNLLVLVVTSGLVLRFLGGAQSLVTRLAEGRS